ncbi:MAG: hypothetical protein ACRDD1_21410, partial [Planctomycetia bacterium]
MISAVVAVVWWDGVFAPVYPLFGLLMAGIVGVAAHELATLLRDNILPVKPMQCVVGCLVIFACNWLPVQNGFSSSPLGDLVYPFLGFTAVAMLACAGELPRYQSASRSVDAIAGTLLVLFYVGVMASFVIRTRWLGDDAAI